MSNSTFYAEWNAKNEAIREKYNIPKKFGQTWTCVDECESGCYKGCDRACYACYVIQDVKQMME